jgi:hypothetical protein
MAITGEFLSEYNLPSQKVNRLSAEVQTTARTICPWTRILTDEQIEKSTQTPALRGAEDPYGQVHSSAPAPLRG